MFQKSSTLMKRRLSITYKQQPTNRANGTGFVVSHLINTVLLTSIECPIYTLEMKPIFSTMLSIRYILTQFYSSVVVLVKADCKSLSVPQSRNNP